MANLSQKKCNYWLLSVLIISLVISGLSSAEPAYGYNFRRILANVSGGDSSVPGSNGEFDVFQNGTLKWTANFSKHCYAGDGKYNIALDNLESTTYLMYHLGLGGTEFWGKVTEDLDANAIAVTKTFRRNMPYVSDMQFAGPNGNYGYHPVFLQTGKTSTAKVVVNIPTDYPYSMKKVSLYLKLRIQDEHQDEHTINLPSKGGEISGTTQTFYIRDIPLNYEGQYERCISLKTQYAGWANLTLTDYWKWGNGPEVNIPKARIKFTIKNVSDGNQNLKGHWKVILYKNNQVVKTETDNDPGVSIRDLDYGKYNYEVYFTMQGESTTEFWGSGQVTVDEAREYETFVRRMPYMNGQFTVDPSTAEYDETVLVQAEVDSNTIKNGMKVYLKVRIGESGDWAESQKIYTSADTYPFSVYPKTPESSGKKTLFYELYYYTNNKYIIVDHGYIPEKVTVQAKIPKGTLIKTGSIEAENGETITLSARLLQSETDTAIAGKTLTFKYPGGNKSGVTNSSGLASCQITANESGTIVINFSGDDDYNTSEGTGTLTVNHSPVASRISPTDEYLVLMVNGSHLFKVQGNDSDNDIDSILLTSSNSSDSRPVKHVYSDGHGSVSAEKDCSWDYSGIFTVQGTVVDKKGKRDTVTWHVTVVDHMDRYAGYYSNVLTTSDGGFTRPWYFDSRFDIYIAIEEWKPGTVVVTSETLSKDLVVELITGNGAIIPGHRYTLFNGATDSTSLSRAFYISQEILDNNPTNYFIVHISKPSNPGSHHAFKVDFFDDNIPGETDEKKEKYLLPNAQNTVFRQLSESNRISLMAEIDKENKKLQKYLTILSTIDSIANFFTRGFEGRAEQVTRAFNAYELAGTSTEWESYLSDTINDNERITFGPTKMQGPTITQRLVDTSYSFATLKKLKGKGYQMAAYQTIIMSAGESAGYLTATLDLIFQVDSVIDAALVAERVIDKLFKDLKLLKYRTQNEIDKLGDAAAKELNDYATIEINQEHGFAWLIKYLKTNKVDKYNEYHFDNFYRAYCRQIRNYIKAHLCGNIYSDVDHDGIINFEDPHPNVPDNHVPDMPELNTPGNGATVSLTPRLTASSFSDGDQNDSHAATQWQVDNNQNFRSLEWDFNDNDADKTSETVAVGKLDYSSKYYWHCRYQDNQGSWSKWSDVGDFTTENAPNPAPDRPILQYPENGEIVDLTPAFLASAFSDPDPNDIHAKTQWQVDDNPNFTLPEWDFFDTDANKISEGVVSGNLDYNTKYYWRCRYQDNHGAWSEWANSRYVVTESAPNRVPEQPMLKIPQNCSIEDLTPTLVAFSFSDLNPGDTHTKTQWQVAGNADFSSILWDKFDTDATKTAETIESGKLQNSTRYYWRCRYQDNHGAWSEWSISHYFTTGDTVNLTPDEPVLESPSNGSIVNLTPTFLASDFSDPDQGNTHAKTHWQVSGNTDFTSVVWDKLDAGAAKTTETIDPAKLQSNTKYYWRCRYQDNHGAWSEWSSTWNFTTKESVNHSPERPTLVHPAIGAIEDLTPGLLSSAFSDPDPGDTHAKTEWQVDNDFHFSSPEWDYYDADPVKHAEIVESGKLQNNTQYYWRCRYQDNHGAWSEWSSSRNFTTEESAANCSPEQPTLVHPEIGSIEDLTPVLQSSPFSDSDSGDTHSKTEWQVDNDSNFSSPEWDYNDTDSVKYAETIESGKLQNSTRYYWRCRYQDNHGTWSEWSASRYFTTEKNIVDSNTFMPDTGQVKFYDNTREIGEPSVGEPFYGQDLNYKRKRSYSKLDIVGNELPDDADNWVMVRDNVTGLIWEIKEKADGRLDYTNPHDADNTYTWFDSNQLTNGGNSGVFENGLNTEKFINDLNSTNFGGYNNWRLPTVKELSQLTDSSRVSPAITTTFFTQILPSDLYIHWTATSGNSYGNNKAWCVYMGYGHVYIMDKANSYYVRAVRSDKPRLHKPLIDNGDGTVSDPNTSLMWQKGETDRMTWQEALEYCEKSNLAGFTDWHMPDRFELQSLAGNTEYDPCFDESLFPNDYSNYYTSYYWTSTTYSIFPSFSWLVNFNGPVEPNSDGKTAQHFVRLVRSEKPRDLYVYVSGDGQCDGRLPCHADIGEAYQKSKNGQLIKIGAGFFLGNLLLDRPVHITLSGGWNKDYTKIIENQPTACGSLIISDGTVVIDRMVIGDGTKSLVKNDDLHLGCGLLEYWQNGQFYIDVADNNDKYLLYAPKISN